MAYSTLVRPQLKYAAAAWDAHTKSKTTGREIDGVSPWVFRCTSTLMETGPIDACVET